MSITQTNQMERGQVRRQRQQRRRTAGVGADECDVQGAVTLQLRPHTSVTRTRLTRGVTWRRLQSPSMEASSALPEITRPPISRTLRSLQDPEKCMGGRVTVHHAAHPLTLYRLGLF